MIDPKELMIGNKVLLQNNKTEVLISQIDNRSNLIEVELPDGGLILRKKGLLNPIPLTPEILERCGFDSIQRDNNNCNVNYTLTKHPQWWIQEHTDVGEFIFYGINNSLDIPITHLHTLQNLLNCLNVKIDLK